MNHALQSALKHFQVHQNELFIGGERVTELVLIHGTPLYVYNKSVIKTKYSLLRHSLPSDLQIHYAVKANPHHDVLLEVAKYYQGFDIASAGEFKKVVATGVDPKKINFAGPGKTREELRHVISHNIRSLSIESEQELQHCIRVCASLHKTQPLLVRVNPSFELSTSGVKMGGGSKVFGIDSERVPEIIDIMVASDNVQYAGLHIFAGSHNLSAEQIVQTFEKIIQYAIEVQKETRKTIKKLNMGGGFGIPLYAHEQELDIHAVGKGLTSLLSKYKKHLPKTLFNIELGRFIIAESGLYLTKILYKKKSRGELFYITDGGMHHQLSASGNLGQSLVKRPMPLIIANKIKGEQVRVHVSGPLCTPLDTFGYVDITEAEEGDLLAVLNSGAYGLTASPVNFLSHALPTEVIV